MNIPKEVKVGGLFYKIEETEEERVFDPSGYNPKFG